MENWEVAEILKRIANLLALKGENEYKIRAYIKAARSISHINEDVVNLANEGRLQELDGIGSALAKKIEEIVTTGKSPLLTRLESELPVELLALFNIPGVGRKIGSQIYRYLNVRSLEEVEEAARQGRIRFLPGLGPKTEEKILKGLEKLKCQTPRYNLKIAYPLSIKIKEWLSSIAHSPYCMIAGSLRRGRETASNINLVMGFDGNVEGLVKQLYSFSLAEKKSIIQNKGSITFNTIWGIPVILNIVPQKLFIPALIYYTGSKGHVKKIMEKAKCKGYKFSASGMYRDEVPVIFREEADFYHLLGMEYIPPELREDHGELDAAAHHRLPLLVDYNDIKGDLHLHSDWSDGIDSIEELANAAEKRGYRYIAITDHSHSLRIASGLSQGSLARQKEYISKVQERFNNIKILPGIEVDILNDCSLDLPDEVLSELDVVIASIHSGFNQPKEKINARLLAAMKNPYVNIIAHPSGRLLGEREPYEVDMEFLLEKAAQTGTFLEINASPDRLDLADVYVKAGKEKGASLVINTDAHSLHDMDYLKYGVMVARRGWLEKENVINTLSWEALKKKLMKKRRKLKKEC